MNGNEDRMWDVINGLDDKVDVLHNKIDVLVSKHENVIERITKNEKEHQTKVMCDERYTNVQEILKVVREFARETREMISGLKDTQSNDHKRLKWIMVSSIVGGILALAFFMLRSIILSGGLK